jgi:coenzyme F420-reducing hydrogenase beta subunit
MEIYAAYYDNQIRNISSSGAIFSAITEEFDVVYGVAMTKDCYGAEMIRVQHNISALLGSKYLQAKVGDSFKQTKADLEKGLKVLFTGTGCQINGLKCFLNCDYNNLICVDVICHGTPSPLLWREYAKYQELLHGKLMSINFRCKDQSWKEFGMKENQLFISKKVDPYMQMFLRNYCLRPSCYECHAKEMKMSDITLGDFWGIENVAPEMNDGLGVSLVIMRSEKGRNLFENIKDKLIYKVVTYEEAIKENSAEYKSVNRPMQRDTFFEDMCKLSFEELSKKYVEQSIWRKIKRKAKRIFLGDYRGKDR